MFFREPDRASTLARSLRSRPEAAATRAPRPRFARYTKNSTWNNNILCNDRDRHLQLGDCCQTAMHAGTGRSSARLNLG